MIKLGEKKGGRRMRSFDVSGKLNPADFGN